MIKHYHPLSAQAGSPRVQGPNRGHKGSNVLLMLLVNTSSVQLFLITAKTSQNRTPGIEAPLIVIMIVLSAANYVSLR